ncbi:MAG: hypothetical protein IT427_04935 [Pirellulales bacterium]|nr:hypothetical protein [Pirellulales bacterium]
MSARKFGAWILPLALLALLRLFVPGASAAADTPVTNAESSGDDRKLASEQGKLADKFKELERVLLRMAEVTQANDPKRAAVLRQVFAKSKEQQVGLQFEDIVKLLENEQLYQASKGQLAVQQDLNRLLELLLTGDRDKQIPNERAEIKKFIEKINRIIRDEQGLQGQTEAEGDAAELAKQQGNVAKKTQELEQELKKFDDRNKPLGAEDDTNPNDGKPEENSGDQPGKKSDDPTKGAGNKSGKKPNDDRHAKDRQDAASKGKENKDADEKEADKKEADKKEADKKDSDRPQSDRQEAGKKDPKQPPADESDSKQSDHENDQSAEPKIPSQSQSKESNSKQPPQPGESSEESDSDQPPQEQPQNQDESPARRRVREAQERMQEAKRKLEQAQRRGAAEEQQKAIDELKQAKAELEEVLRQLREEEIERTLAMLEGRFRKMLQMQIEVYEGTVRLDRVPEDQRDRDIEIESAKLSRREAEITSEADKTLNLLREEGSSVAFPEAVDQMREDMETVTQRLSKANVGQLTQGIEQDIVKALEEMIASLQKAQKDAQKRRGGGGGGGGGDQDQDLVDQIAEIKMIRALQMRVNTRTQRYTRMLEDGAEQAAEPDLLEAIRRLSEREDRIYKTTRDIVVGRNK